MNEGQTSINSVDGVWKSILGVLAGELTETSINTWFSDCKPVEITSNQLVLYTPTDFKRSIIKERFAGMITAALSDLFSCSFDLLVLAEEELDDYERAADRDDNLPEIAGYTFDKFIVGNSNKFAHAAAVAVADKPGQVYNPLFIYGNSGLGKTHLLLSIGQRIHETKPNAKIAYVSPALFGVQLALSFTPNQGKNFLPFVNAGPDVPGRQAAIWEAGLRYSTDVGPVSLTGYGGIAEGRGEHKLAGQRGVSDLGFGLRADYTVNDDLSLSLGGSYRSSNAYAFDITRSYDGASTRALHASATATYGDWIAGIEYGNAVAGHVANLGANGARLGLNGAQASLGYVLNANWQITGGWQRLDYARDGGIFFNGAPDLKMDAGFLHLAFHL